MHFSMPGWPVYNHDGASHQRTWIHAADRYQFATNGYMVIRDVIPSLMVATAIRDNHYVCWSGSGR